MKKLQLLRKQPPRCDAIVVAAGESRRMGGVDKLIDWDKKDPQTDLMRYMDDARAKEDKLFDDPKLMKTPIVRNGKKATVGYCPEIWETWE